MYIESGIENRSLYKFLCFKMNKNHTVCCTGEDNSWKDELLELSRSKQARAESELQCLRQVSALQNSLIHIIQ